MDWRSVRFDWNRARAFLVTAEEGSLSAAARALGMAQPTLGRQVDALEEELGVALFERVGRGLELTPHGHALLEHVRLMGEAAGRMSIAASGQTQTLEGSICITASEVFAAHLLAPLVTELRQLEPGIEIEIVASNDPIDLLRREADIAIRNFRPTQPELIGKKLKDDVARLYAARTYLDTLRNPREPACIELADFIGFDTTTRLTDRLTELGVKVSNDNIKIISTNQLVQWELIKAGAGIGLMPEAIGDAELRVERVLDSNFEPMRIPMWLVVHREVHTSRRVRFVFDFLAEKLAG